MVMNMTILWLNISILIHLLLLNVKYMEAFQLNLHIFFMKKMDVFIVLKKHIKIFTFLKRMPIKFIIININTR